MIKMSSEEEMKKKKKKEKGKEVVNFEEDSSSLKEVLIRVSSDDDQDKRALEEPNEEDSDQSKVGVEEEKSSCSKINPCISYTSDHKARLRWSNDLHDCFLNAVAKLGGPYQATPKSVKQMMEVEGISLYHVKSHLQKFRLGKCNIRDGRNQYFRRFRIARDIRKQFVSLNSPLQVNTNPKVTKAAKPKRKKEKEVRGSLYKLIEEDLHLQKFREEQMNQMAFAIVNNQCNMLETPYVQANDSQQSSVIIPQTTTSVEIFCNNDIACSLNDCTQNCLSNTSSLYESAIHAPQVDLEFCGNQTNNMAQGFIDPHMGVEPLSMFNSSTITTQQQLQLNNDSLHQGTLESLTPMATKSISAYVPCSTDSSYPQYNTLEVVKAQLDSLQNSNTSKPQEGLNLSSSSVTTEEVDLVDKYIDWAKVEELNFEFDPVEVLEALGFGVNP